MITVKGPSVRIEGDGAEILAEFSTLARNLRECLAKAYGEKEATRLADLAYEDSKKSPEQIVKEIANVLKDKDMLEIITAIAEAIKEGSADE